MEYFSIKSQTILNLILTLKNLDYRIDHELMVISTKKRCYPPSVLRMYDIRDICINPYYDFFSTGKKRPPHPDDCLLCCFGGPSYPPSVSTYITSEEEDMIKLIKDNIGKTTWEEVNVSIDVRRGIIIMRHSPDIHQEVFRFIDYLRKQNRKNRRMISIWAYLAPKGKPPETMTLLATCNRQKVCLKGGVLYMGNTPQDKEKRKEEIQFLDTQTNLQDQVEKREAVSISVTPLIDKEGVKLTLDFDSWGVCGVEHSLNVFVPNGKTVPVAIIPGDKQELSLFAGAFVEQEE